MMHNRLMAHRDIAQAVARKVFENLNLRQGESLEQFSRRTGKTLNTMVYDEFAKKMKMAYDIAIRAAAKETGIRFKFTPLDDRLVRQIIYSPNLETALNNYTSEAVGNIKDVIYEATQRQMPWTEVQQRIEEVVDPIQSHGITMARMEMSNVYNQAKAHQYHKLDPTGDKYRYRWIGPQNWTTTDMCKHLKEMTHKGMTLAELKMTIETATHGPDAMKGFTYDPTRPWTPHFNCYVDGYEVLTTKGWRKIQDVHVGDTIWSMDMKTREMVQDHIAREIRQWHIGNFVILKNKWFYAETTDDHDFIIETKDHQMLAKRKKAKEFTPGNGILTGGLIWNGRKDETITIADFTFKTEDFAELMGWFLSEGYIQSRRTGKSKYLAIAQYKEENRMMIAKLLKRMFGKVCISHGKLRVTLSDHPEFTYWLRSLGHSHEKFIPDEIKGLDKKYLRKFLDAFILGDGYLQKCTRTLNGKIIEGSIERAFTSSRQLADDLCEIILKCGYGVKCLELKVGGKSHKFKNGTYIIKTNTYSIFIKRTTTVRAAKLNQERYFDCKMVYDLTTEKTGTLIVRKDGYVMVGSNCRHQVEMIMKWGED